jgi:hypothetical protein
MITDLRANSPDGTDILVSIEQLRFADQDSDLTWATPLIMGGVVLQVQTPMDGYAPVGQSNFDFFTGYQDTMQLSLVSVDAQTRTWVFEAVANMARNPHYQAGGQGMVGELYVYGVTQYKVQLPMGAAVPNLTVGQPLSRADIEAIDQWIASSVGVTLSQGQLIAFGSTDGVTGNGNRYDMETWTFSNYDIKIFNLDLPNEVMMGWRGLAHRPHGRRRA